MEKVAISSKVITRVAALASEIMGLINTGTAIRIWQGSKPVINPTTQQEVCDHLWFTVGKQLDKLNLKEKEVIRFDARVTRYVKGYVHRDEDNREIDYRLSFPNKFVKVVSDGIGVSENAQSCMTLNCFNDETPSQDKIKTVYTAEELIKLLEEDSDKETIYRWIDSKAAMEKQNKELEKILETYREQRRIFIATLPNVALNLTQDARGENKQ